VVIFDTTLRDGEQSPGASMGIAAKLELAGALAELGVDVLEAGFPIASPGDFAAVQAIARGVDGPVIAALARATRGDIERAWDAIRDAPRGRLHVFLATSEIHRTHKLRMARGEIVRRTRAEVARARDLCDEVEFSPEDASRTERDFLVEVVETAIEAGATTINIPDTVGYAIPGQFAALIRHLRQRVRGIEGAVLSVHCHDDLGLAVANSVAAVWAGARQVECTMNGIGERAGNASLEEVVMTLRTRRDFFGLATGIDSRLLCPTSRLLTRLTGLEVQRNKAIVGANAFAHEAGIHQHGMLMHASTYEIMRPEDVGVDRSRLVLGKHSGRHALRRRVEELGHELGDEAFEQVFEAFKALADHKREVFDADLAALLDGRSAKSEPHWRLERFQAVAGADLQHFASVDLRDSEDRLHREAACGDGPIDAVFQAVQRLTGVAARLLDYRVSSVSVGKDAQGEAVLQVEYAGETYHGRAISTDIIDASVRAYLSIVNRITDRLVGASDWPVSRAPEATASWGDAGDAPGAGR
jgi:2-isopropylmalate synthase